MNASQLADILSYLWQVKIPDIALRSWTKRDRHSAEYWADRKVKYEIMQIPIAPGRRPVLPEILQHFVHVKRYQMEHNQPFRKLPQPSQVKRYYPELRVWK